MNELRKDYLLDRWVIIASGRSKRPQLVEGQAPAGEGKKKTCFFCPGSEHTTPPEISRVSVDGQWIIRVFPNKYPALTLEEGDRVEGESYTMRPAYGSHEVIVESSRHDADLADLSVSHLMKVFDVYQERINALQEVEGIKYVLVFKNKGAEGGASLEHTHTQVTALPVVPPLVKRELEAVKKSGGCPFCEILSRELGSGRRVFEDEHVAVFTPYASRFPYEVWLMPKEHRKTLGELTGEEKESMADALKKLLTKINSGFSAYNFYMHVAPKDDDLHFHIELFPKSSRWAGFEYGSDIIINTTTPEYAAEYYREAF